MVNNSNLKKFLEDLYNNNNPNNNFHKIINEDTLDNRIPIQPKTHTSISGPNGMPGIYDPKLYSGQGYGRRIRQSLGYSNDGTSYTVTDLGQVIVVVARYFNLPTGKEISKTFAIVFGIVEPGKSLQSGRIFTTSTKWRDISSPDQAASYIKMYVNSMMGSTKNA